MNTSTGDLLTVIEQPPIDTQPQISDTITPLTDIISDTRTGGTNYENRIVRVTGAVTYNFTPRLDFLELQTDANDVYFVVWSPNNSDRISHFGEGVVYDFTLLVSTQTFWTDREIYEIHTHVIDPSEPETITLDDLISDVKNGNNVYQGTVVNLNAEVLRNGTTHVTLKTDDPHVVVYIRKTGNGYEDEYKAHQSYDLPLYIECTCGSNQTDIAIWTLLVVQ